MKRLVWGLLGLALSVSAGELSKKAQDVGENADVTWTQRKKGAGSVFEIKPSAIRRIIKKKPEKTRTKILLDGSTQTLLLTKHDPFNFESKGVHYQGIVKGDKDSLVSLSFAEKSVTGLIQFKNKIYDVKTTGVVTEVIDVTKEKLPALDESNLKAPKGATLEGMSPLTLDGALEAIAPKTLNVAFEIDYAGFMAFGSEANARQVFETNFAGVATFFANQGFTVRAHSLKVWTTTDPYVAPNATMTLYNFADKNMGKIPAGAQAMQLLTVRGWGGIAYVNQLCRSIPFGVASIWSTAGTNSTYNWPVYVMAHELGHTMGSGHTHACRWNGNNTALDGCFQPEGTCPRPVNPQGFKGTIMSYCHVSSAGVDFNQGFGPQPLAVVTAAWNAATCLPQGVQNDVTKPTITITAPTANASVSGSFAVNASAGDNVGVTKVDFGMDGLASVSDASSPFTATFNTTTLPNGSRAITATAFDAAGNSQSASITVNVQNASQAFAISQSVVGQDKSVADATRRNWIDLTLSGLVGTPTFAAKLATNTSWSAKTPLVLGNNTFRVYVNSANTDYDASATCSACTGTKTVQVRFKTLP